jgi:peptidyl-prolyl cis-trans isomerase SurA
MKKIFLTLLFFLMLNQVQSIETRIIHNIQNEIITNIDIKNEFKYLMALNNSLQKLDKEKIYSISNESIIREKIKKIEILKNFKEIKINEDYSNLLIKNIYLRINLKSLNEFEKYLKSYGLTINDIKTKTAIDALWNELIMQKYGAKININKSKIEEEILKNSKIQIKEYQLSEIIFEVINKDEIEKKYKEVVKSIDREGFENSAAIYSFSESAKIGGDIGWINENSLNNNIKKNIKDLKHGQITKPIILSNGILILRLEDTKTSESNINVKNELKTAIIYERNRQLNEYSKIYYNKIKKNLDFNG